MEKYIKREIGTRIETYQLRNGSQLGNKLTYIIEEIWTQDNNKIIVVGGYLQGWETDNSITSEYKDLVKTTGKSIDNVITDIIDKYTFDEDYEGVITKYTGHINSQEPWTVKYLEYTLVPTQVLENEPPFPSDQELEPIEPDKK